MKSQSFGLICHAVIVTRTKLDPEGRSVMILSVLSKEAGEQIKVSIERFFQSLMRVVKDNEMVVC